jgi:monoamine oxidase
VDTYDYIIVGAGIGGIVLAKKIKEQGLSYLMLEASDHLGGRINSTSVDDAWFELGAARVLSSQNRVMNLIRELKLELEEQLLTDAAVYIEGAWHDSLNELLSNVEYPDPFELFYALLEQTGIESLSDFERLAPLEWDSVLTRDWLASNGIPTAFSIRYFLGDIDVTMKQITLYESMYFFVANVSALNSKVYRMKGGLSQLVNTLSCRIQSPLFKQHVEQVSFTTDGVIVKTTTRTFHSRKVVFTCSLNALSHVELPAEAKDTLTKCLAVGHYGKSIKGIVTFNSNVFPNHEYLITEDPMRMLRRSEFHWELYLPSLEKSWDRDEIIRRLNDYFGVDSVRDLKLHTYNTAPFYGCYWNYKSGYFHRIFEFSKAQRLAKHVYSVGEHFSLNPNWIEGTLESVDQFILNDSK